jgi:hypothetical protein
MLETTMYYEEHQSEEQHLLKSVYSMMQVIKIISFLYKMEGGRNGVGWGTSKRGRERKREAD